MVFFCHVLLARVPPRCVSLCRSPEMIFHGHPWLLKVVRPGSPLNEEPRPTLLYYTFHGEWAHALTLTKLNAVLTFSHSHSLPRMIKSTSSRICAAGCSWSYHSHIILHTIVNFPLQHSANVDSYFLLDANLVSIISNVTKIFSLNITTGLLRSSSWFWAFWSSPIM